MIWSQEYDPLGNAALSTICAALPVLVLLGTLGVLRVRAHHAALYGLGTSLIIATLVFGMPARMAVATAADALEEAIAGRIDDRREIPAPSAPRRGERMVSVPPSMALKAVVYLAVQDAGISNSELARRMKLDEKEARRILDPHHPTRLSKIEEALSVLGRHVELALA